MPKRKILVEHARRLGSRDYFDVIYSTYCLVYNMDKWRICGNAEFNAIFLRLRWKLEDFDQMQARSQGGGGGSGGSADPPLENQRSTFWNLAREIIKANNYKWLTIYLHQLLCTKPHTKWLQNLLSKGGSGGAFLWLCRVAVNRVPHTPSADPPLRLGWLRAWNGGLGACLGL